MHTYTLTVAGMMYTATSMGTPACRDCIGRIYAHTQPPTDDGMTAQDWQRALDAAAERAQRQDDAATYGTGRPDAWSVGY
jgi:hypothetical protein